MLTNRMMSMMENILQNPSGIKVKDFAALYAVSGRVIYYDLEELSYYVKQEELPFSINVSGGLITCACGDEQAVTLWKEHIEPHPENIIYTPEERILKILSGLLHGNMIRISSLTEEMGVSKSTVINDMDSIKQFYEDYDVKVSAAARNGFRFEGKEEDICIASYHYLFSLLKYNNVIGRMYTEPDIWKRKPYRDYLNEGQFRRAEEAVMEVLEECDSSYRMSNDCLCAVIIMVSRNIKTEEDIFSDARELLENTEILSTAELIVKKIKDMQPDVGEKDFACFLALCMLRPGADYHRTLYLNQSIDLRVLAANFANKVCARFGVPVGNNLLYNIRNDMFLLITQPDMLISTWNEKIVRIMRQEYEDLYKIVKESSGMISDAFRHELTDRQIVYLMLNFVEMYEQQKGEERNKDVILVCNSGSVISRRLSNQLQVFFNIHIVATVSTYELNIALEKYNPEYIISTIPVLPGKTKYVFVNQFLGQNDLNELSAFFSLRKGNFNQEDLQMLISDSKDEEEQSGESLSSIVVKECIYLDAEYASISEAVHAGGVLLKNQGFIEDAYIEDIRKAVLENGRFMLIGPDIIMPHSIAGYHVNRTGISIVRLKKPVRLEDVDVEVNWIFTLCAVDRKSHLKALTQLTDIIGDDSRMQLMKEAKSADELHQLLGE